MADNEKSETSVEFVSDTQSSAGSDLPPPAYRKPYSNSVRIARILSTAFVFVSIVVGVVILLALYMEKERGCSCPVREDVQRRAMADFQRDNTRSAALDALRPEGDPMVAATKKIPLKLTFDRRADSAMKKNKMSRVNCMVETKKATHIIVPRPKTVVTPFGNFSTDPRLIHVAGEKMIFSCFGENKRAKYKKPQGIHVEKRSAGECACDCAC